MKKYNLIFFSKFLNQNNLFFLLFLAIVLRVIILDKVPPGLYWDEAALGYDAYSLLKTGHDHRGNGWPVLWVDSYLDYKPPLYIYTTIPFIAVFGLNSISVRLPAVFFSVMTGFLVYQTVIWLFKDRKWAWWSAFLYYLSPTGLLVGRVGFEVNLAVLLVMAGIFFWLKGKDNDKYFIVSAISFGLSPYAYHGAKILTPLLVIGLIILTRKTIVKLRPVVLVAFLVGFLLFLPHLLVWQRPESRQRWQETSALLVQEPVLESNQEINQDNNSVISRLVHHRFWKYGKIILANYLDHFEIDYLFISGDSNTRHSVGVFGFLYHFEFLTVLIGFIVLVTSKKEKMFILLPVLLIPITASLTKATPHSLRILFNLPFFAIISGLGLVSLHDYFKHRKDFVAKLELIGFASFIIIDISLFLNYFFRGYPVVASSAWQYAYQPLFEYLSKVEDKYNRIYISNEYGRAYMYYLFYRQIDPNIAQKEIKQYKNLPDIPRIGQYYFGDISGRIPSGSLVVDTNKSSQSQTIMKEIIFLDNHPAFYIYEE
jgi:4-amino-4-deoxy-L-arabinose transferase-like glycosyltransferase